MPVFMVAEIMLAEYLFAGSFKKRKFFAACYLGYGAVAAASVFWLQAVYNILTDRDFSYGSGVSGWQDSIFNFFFYCMVFAVTCVVCVLSYKEPLTEILFCCSGAYATQHIARNLGNLVTTLFFENFYPEITVPIVTVCLYAAVYTLVYFLIAKPRRTLGRDDSNKKRKVVISLVVLILCIGMSRLTSDNANRDRLSAIAESVYAIVCCMLVLYVQSGITENDDMRHEVAGMQELLRQERKQYELSKETIELINIKCHDLKHQIAALRKNATEESISEIEHAVMIYDCTVKTGNDVLDVILTEKKLLCESKNIQMTCVVKGELISFLDTLDIYSLFGNALSNAIESVSEEPDIDNRCIGVTIKSIGGMLFIHVENYFSGQITLENGLPVTERDKNYHGFGMKSMERVAAKYGGEISVVISDGKFNLDVILPIPKNKSTAKDKTTAKDKSTLKDKSTKNS